MMAKLGKSSTFLTKMRTISDFINQQNKNAFYMTKTLSRISYQRKEQRQYIYLLVFPSVMRSDFPFLRIVTPPILTKNGFTLQYFNHGPNYATNKCNFEWKKRISCSTRNSLAPKNLNPSTTSEKPKQPKKKSTSVSLEYALAKQGWQRNLLLSKRL